MDSHCRVFAASVLLTGLMLTKAFSGEPIEVGSVILAPIEDIEVPAQESGVIRELAAQEGASVKAGDLLARIDDSLVELQRRRVAIELEDARRKAHNDIDVRVHQKAAAMATADLQRALDSAKRFPKSVTETEIDRLRLAVEHAELKVEQAKHDFETAAVALQLQENALAQVSHQLQRRQIKTPVSGRVVQCYRRRGEWVEPGQSVTRILVIDRLKAVGSLSADVINQDLTGREVTLHVTLADGGQQEFPGRIAFVHSEINPVNRQVDFWAEIENPAALLQPGQLASLTIQARQP